MTNNNILCILSLFSAIYASAQSPVAYGYDASGNRISRTGVSMNANRAKGVSPKNTHGADNQTNINTLSYDETSNIINVGLASSQLAEDSKLSVFSIAGELVYSCEIHKGKSNVDTSSFPSGTYVAVIIAGQKKQSIKFTKK